MGVINLPLTREFVGIWWETVLGYPLDLKNKVLLENNILRFSPDLSRGWPATAAPPWRLARRKNSELEFQAPISQHTFDVLKLPLHAKISVESFTR